MGARFHSAAYFAVLLCLSGVLCSPTATRAQQPSDSADAAAATGRADSLQAALDRFRASSSPTAADSTALQRWADSAATKGRTLSRKNPSQARDDFQRALRANRALADSIGMAEMVREIGITYFYQGRYEEALDHLERSLTMHRAHGTRRGIADALNGIGYIQKVQGHYQTALTRLQDALAIFRELDTSIRIAAALNNVGTVYDIQGRYGKALQYYRESLAIFREMGDQGGIADALNNIGLIQETRGRYSEALQNYRKSLAIERELDNPNGIALSLNNIGDVYRKQGHSEKALRHFREALEAERELGNQGVVAEVLANIGETHRGEGRFEKALRHYRRALDLNRTLERRRNEASNLASVGGIYLEQGRPSPATDTLRRAVGLAERIRLSTTSPGARRSLLSMQIEAYHALTAAYVRFGKPDSALRSLERARARLLADRLAGTATGDTTFAIPSADALRRTLGPNEAALLYANAGTRWPLTALAVTRDRAYVRALPDSTIRTEVAKAYATRLHRLRRTEGPLTAALRSGDAVSEGTRPSHAEMVRLYRYDLVRGGTSSVQRDLGRRLHDLLVAPVERILDDEDELIVVPSGALGYLPFETLRDSTGTYLVEKQHVRYAQSLTVLRQLQQRDYTDRERSLLTLGGAAYTSDGPMESGAVIAEARRGTTQVATRGHAATLLQDASRRMKQGKSPRRVYQQLGYGGWPDLPGTKSEAETLGERAGEGATVITGAGASEDSVRALSENGQLGEYRRLHFATHGIAVPETPKLSALVLSQVGASDSLAARDGYLTMEEIADLKMKAEVAVLSACQTGLGKVVAGEGVVSLSHAFLRAGANATLVSQWKVLDESTRQFMTAVYERAKAEDTSFAEAVTETKRAFIAGEYGENNPDPLRWAPFVYYGHD